MAKARRGAGEGSFYYRKADNKWVGVVTLPPGPDGKRRRKVVTAVDRGTAQRKFRELQAELARTGDLETSAPTVEAWLGHWLDVVAAPRLKPRTLDGYRGYVDRYINPVIGRYRLHRLTTEHVRRLHTTIIDRGLSSTTALQAHRILAKALTDAVREGKVSRNVASLVDAPRRAVTARDALDAQEAGTLLRAVWDGPDAARWAVALLTGLRQGERLGMTVDEIDLRRGIITVQWQLQRLRWHHGCAGQTWPPPRRPAAGWPCGLTRAGACPDRYRPLPPGHEAKHVDGGLWLTRPKSRAGWREVPITPQLKVALARHMDAHSPGIAGLVFTRDGGRPIDPSEDTRAWDALLAELGLPDVVQHSARHTANTLLHALGVDDAIRQRIMGHSSAVVNLGYVHVADPLMVDAMGRLGDLLLSPSTGQDR